MKFCTNNIAAWNRVTGVLLFIGLLVYAGCATTNFPGSKTLEIKPVEATVEEYFKKLRTVEELTLKTELSSQIVIAKGTPEYFIEYPPVFQCP